MQWHKRQACNKNTEQGMLELFNVSTNACWQKNPVILSNDVFIPYRFMSGKDESNSPAVLRRESMWWLKGELLMLEDFTKQYSHPAAQQGLSLAWEVLGVSSYYLLSRVHPYLGGVYFLAHTVFCIQPRLARSGCLLRELLSVPASSEWFRWLHISPSPLSLNPDMQV